MRYEIVVKESNGLVVDVLNVGTPKGNIPQWAQRAIQEHAKVFRICTVSRIKQDS